jgi:hypothetical protein
MYISPNLSFCGDDSFSICCKDYKSLLKIRDFLIQNEINDYVHNPFVGVFITQNKVGTIQILSNF